MIHFLVHVESEKNAGLWFAAWVSAEPDTMPNVTIYIGSLKSQDFLCQP